MNADQFLAAMATTYALAEGTALKLDLALIKQGGEGLYFEKFQWASIKPGYSRILYAALRCIRHSKLPSQSWSKNKETSRPAYWNGLDIFAMHRHLLGQPKGEAITSIKDCIATAANEGDDEFFRLLGIQLNAKPRGTGAKDGTAKFIRDILLPVVLFEIENTAEIREQVRAAACLLGQRLTSSDRELSKAINTEMRAFRKHLEQTPTSVFDSLDFRWEQITKRAAAGIAI